MEIQALAQAFTVCKVKDAAYIDLAVPFTFAGVTDGELSLVCPTESAPAQTLAREDGWRAFRVAGSMAFELVGVLARMTGALAARQIPVFALSTFDTDYVLVKAEHFENALEALVKDGVATVKPTA